MLFLLPSLLWAAPGTLHIAPRSTWRSEVPAAEAPARLSFRAHVPSIPPAGSNHVLRIQVNGRDVGLMRSRRKPRLLNKPEALASATLELPWFDFARWRVRYVSIPSAEDEFVLDISDLLTPDRSNSVAFEYAPPKSALPLAIDHLRIDLVAAQASEPFPPPPDWRTPRFRLPRPPALVVDASDLAVNVTWQGYRITVDTIVRGGTHDWRRHVATLPTHVEVRDTVGNPGRAVIGLHIRHAVKTQAEWLHIGGRSDPDTRDAYNPWNPTVFTPLAAGGIGLVAEDDVFRNQLHVSFSSRDDTVGLRTDMLCLAPGDTYTLTWSIYPTRTDNYWDFINTVRQDWGVNRTVPGSYVWFAPDQVLSMSPAQLHKALGLQKVAIASMYGGWVDPMRQAEPPLIGFGTFVMSGEFTNFRTRIRDAIDRIKHARPGIAALAYFNSQRDSTPDAPARYGDSLLTQQGATPEHTDWGGRYSTTWSMVPTDSNTFGRAMQSVAKASRDLGADGLYWDEMDGVDYRAPRITTSRWDHHTCLLTDQGDVKAEVGLANLLSESVKLDYAGTGLILGNTPPTTRHFQGRPDIRIVEAHHQERWGAFAHLTTPLGYIGTERKDWAMVLERLDEPLLIAGTQFDYPFDFIARMFPFTPDYMQPGTLRGRERIITSRSGTHGWPGYSGPIRGFRYDRWGKEHDASWHTKYRPDGVRVRVRLRPGEAAIIERDA